MGLHLMLPINTIAYLKELFNSRLLALGTDNDCAPQYPDLNPLNFWLWGTAKQLCLLTNQQF